ncbi:flagellar biosynthetic protein FliO [Desulfovibrio sp.]|uniref:flagellar biosynthetic protein FliO n=1 Tax=Desulfovibrio sp. TaxID=885 RepID=UPI0025C046D0|nr:flagellar biosynthetic protein FliO [Desulfovibrio sp.]
MASLVHAVFAAGALALSATVPANGVAGQAVRGTVEAAAPSVAAPDAVSGLPGGLEQVVERAAELTRQGLGAAAQAAGHVAESLGDSLESGLAGDVAGSAAAHGAGLGGTSFSWGGYAQAVGILFLLVALLWLVVWLVRRFGKFNFLPRPGALPKGALVMEAQLPLGPRKGLMVVRFLNRRLLLGVTDQHITLLTEEQAQHEPQNKDFQHVMEEVARGADSR